MPSMRPHVGESVTPADHETSIAIQVWTSQNGQEAAAVLERDGSPLPTAVLSFDTRVEGDRARWHDWLHLANILQHLGDNAIVTTTRTYAPGDLGGGVAATASSPAAVASELLGDILDPGALPLGQAAFDADGATLSLAIRPATSMTPPSRSRGP